MAKFSYKTTTVRPGKGTPFSNIIKEIKKDFGKYGEEYNNRFRDEIQGRIDVTSDYFVELQKAFDNLGMVFNADDWQLPTVGLQKDLSRELIKLRKAISVVDPKGTYQVDHASMAPINQSTTALIISLLDLITYLERLNTGGEYRKGLDITETYNVPQAQKGSGNLKQRIGTLKAVVNKLRQVRAFGEAIERAYGTNGTALNSLDIQREYEGLIKNGVLDIELIKNKDIQFTNNTLANFEVILKSKHDVKSRWQGTQGVLRSKARFGKTPKSLTGDARERAITAAQIIQNYPLAEITGSKKISKALGEQIADTFKGKPKRRYKSSTKKTEKIKSRPKPLRKPKSTAGLDKAILAAEKGLKKKAPTSKGKKKTEAGSLNKELNKLKTLINRKLGAEVRRNMGRPALTNRSGTFSNSVRLLNLREGTNTYVGEYTYMKTGGGTPPRSGQPGVYQTFEGEGKNIWPRGYNPKPLIAKSIRNLARQYTDAKFTLRRV